MIGQRGRVDRDLNIRLPSLEGRGNLVRSDVTDLSVSDTQLASLLGYLYMYLSPTYKVPRPS